MSEKDEIPLDRYLDYANRAEQLLEKHHIKSNGCANGDYPIGKYTSLRNEKFVAIEDDEDRFKRRLIYPPNACGYNGSRDRRDLTREIVNLQTYRARLRHNKITKLFILLTVILLLIVFLINSF
ncbi:unnamed protein product [Adineta ricciae]|nr:unnamed protein product [Adineta ricciae]